MGIGFDRKTQESNGLADRDLLAVAVVTGNARKMGDMIRSGLDANGSLNGSSLSEWAVYLDHPEILALLERNGATPLSESQKSLLRKERMESDVIYRELQQRQQRN